jgi:hypothetical protein
MVKFDTDKCFYIKKLSIIILLKLNKFLIFFNFDKLKIN